MSRILPLSIVCALLLGPTCRNAPDADDLESLIAAAGPGGTVAIDQTYYLDRSVKPLAGQIWEGSGSLVRAVVPRTRLSAPAQAGDTTVTVDSTHGFQVGVGHLLGFGEGPFESGESECATWAHWPQALTESTITFSGGLCHDYPAGTLVYPMYSLVVLNDVDDVVLRGITLDGAEATQPAFHSWKMAHNLQATDSDRLTLEDVRVVNAWGNGLQLEGVEDGTLDGVLIQNVRCGGVHIGYTERLLVSGSTFKGVGTFAEECSHSEGAFTYSLYNSDVEITDTCFAGNHAPWGAIARMNLASNEGLLLQRNRACGGPHLFSARATGFGSIVALDNEASVTGEVFSVPEGTDFGQAGTTLLQPNQCGC